ncbi:MAG: hypothetical protein DWQ02_03070 [Bacteroidetes bacterium]|nr:MAG: hypothetical protein DWQ02_03070 [Bacteroidota bacterium]
MDQTLVNSKALERFSQLSLNEMKAFARFSTSPYHSSNKRLAKMVGYLTYLSRRGKLSSVTKKKLFSEVFGKEALFQEGRINLLLTQMVSLMEEFLVFESFKNDDFQYQKRKLKIFEERQWDSAFFKLADNLKQDLDQQHETQWNLLEKFHLNWQIFYHHGTDKYQKDLEVFKSSQQYITLFFLWQSMTFAVEAKNRSKVLGEEHDLGYLNDFMEYFREEIDRSPVLSFYRKLLELFETDSIFLLKELINEVRYILPALDKELQQNCLVTLLNMAARKYRNGFNYFKKALYELYREGVGRKLFLENGRINDIIFTNIVSIASANHAYNWVNRFMREHNSFLGAKVKVNAMGLSRGYYYFHRAVELKRRSDWMKVLDHLNTTQFSGINYRTRARSLLIRAYYEYYLDIEENLSFVLDQITAFEQQLRRKKSVLGQRAVAFQNFCRETGKLANMKFKKKNLQQIVEYRESLKNMVPLFSKEWLIEKAGEIVEKSHRPL